MEYVQEQFATLHDFGGATPEAPVDRAAVVVPMTERDRASLAAERVLEALETIGPGRVVIALRADRSALPAVVDWLEGYDLPLEVCWCTAPAVEAHLAEAGLDVPAGKGRDVWLALGIAGDADYVVVHDADAKSYATTHVPRLLFPLAGGAQFSKGYYARVENGQLYGRLVRLFVAPVLRALRATQDAPILRYLDAFRYPLAGEFAMTGGLARRLRAQPGWGLEIGSLGESYAAAGFAGTAQVDLGTHEHDHRSVSGPDGLGDMSREVAAALFRVLTDHELDPDYGALRERYRAAAEELIEQYATDAAFNDLSYDQTSEREQVATYAEAVEPPGPDGRLPAWTDAPVDTADVRELSSTAIADATER